MRAVGAEIFTLYRDDEDEENDEGEVFLFVGINSDTWGDDSGETDDVPVADIPDIARSLSWHEVPASAEGERGIGADKLTWLALIELGCTEPEILAAEKRFG